MCIDVGIEINYGGHHAKVRAVGDAPWGDAYLIIQVPDLGTSLRGYADWVRRLGGRYSLAPDDPIILLPDDPNTYVVMEGTQGEKKVNTKLAKEALRAGKSFTITPRGNSMRPIIHSGDKVTLEPCSPDEIKPGDAVLVRVRGKDYIHLVKAVEGVRFQIGNNQGHINGWVGPAAIYGKVTHVEGAVK